MMYLVIKVLAFISSVIKTMVGTTLEGREGLMDRGNDKGRVRGMVKGGDKGQG